MERAAKDSTSLAGHGWKLELDWYHGRKQPQGNNFRFL